MVRVRSAASRFKMLWIFKITITITLRTIKYRIRLFLNIQLPILSLLKL